MPLTAQALFRSENIPIIEIDAGHKIVQIGRALSLRMPELAVGAQVESVFPTLPLARLLADASFKARVNLYKAHASPVSHDAFAVISEGRVFLVFEPVIDDIQRLQQEIIRMNNDLSNAMREIQKKNAELSQLNTLKNEFLGMAAHDLRTPIANIYSFSDLALLDSDKMNEELLQYLTEIKALAEFMMQLLNDLLDLTTIESGSLRLNLKEQSLAAIVARSIRLHIPMAEKKGVILRSALSEDEQAVHVDALKIGQVCNNLIGNAIKFSPATAEVIVSSGHEGNELWFEVKDHGPGIEGIELSQLFEPFRKGSNLTAGPKGHGLGLAISKKIVDAHGGRLQVISKAGQGATFRVYLPV